MRTNEIIQVISDACKKYGNITSIDLEGDDILLYDGFGIQAYLVSVSENGLEYETDVVGKGCNFLGFESWDRLPYNLIEEIGSLVEEFVKEKEG